MMPPCSVHSAKSPCAHTPSNFSKYAPRSLAPSGSFKKPTGRDGKDFVQTNSPFPRGSDAPPSSKMSTAMPSPLHCNSPAYTGNSGLPRAKQEMRSVPPEMDATGMPGFTSRAK